MTTVVKKFKKKEDLNEILTRIACLGHSAHIEVTTAGHDHNHGGGHEGHEGHDHGSAHDHMMMMVVRIYIPKTLSHFLALKSFCLFTVSFRI